MKCMFSSLCLLVIVLNACNNTTNQDDAQLKDKLSTELVSNPISLENQDAGQLSQLGRLQFVDTVHDFKTINQGEKVTTEFEFTNVGNKPILITAAEASCGCTLPEYPKEPIAKNEHGKLKVTFNSEGKYGYNEKNIVVTTNGNPSEYILQIKVDVKK